MGEEKQKGKGGTVSQGGGSHTWEENGEGWATKLEPKENGETPQHRGGAGEGMGERKRMSGMGK